MASTRTKTYRNGTIVAVGKRDAILALVEPSKACLVDLLDGNRWNEPVVIKDPDSITLTEIKMMASPYTIKIVKERT
jgi:hypothetical protein